MGTSRSHPADAEAVILDGPLGTELHARGIATPLPGWSAHALLDAPDVVRAIHADYATAGARVHTTNTFRTRPEILGGAWEAVARSAVRIVRDAVPRAHRVAGSIAPLRDCYRPDLSPADADPSNTRERHASLARVLAEEGCDILLCETFPHVREALLAVAAARSTGCETWVSFTPGPAVDLLTPDRVADAARRAADLGAAAVLVNCLPAGRTLEFVQAITAEVGSEVLVGAYANAGEPNDETGWDAAPGNPREYAARAAEWRAAGASILGACCGTGVGHIAALAGLRDR